MFIRISQQILDFIRKSEGETVLRIADKVDAAKCLSWSDLKAFIQGLTEKRQAEFAALIKFEDLIMEVQHKNEMKVHSETEATKRLREKLRLKKEKREIYQLTGRTLNPPIPGDESLKAYEKSVKFAMSYLFALFTSSIGGYFASKVFFGFDHVASLLIAGIVMFATVMIEVGLYITKTLKSDMVTQKAKKFQKRTEDKRFDDHYSRVKAANSIQSNGKYADELVNSELNEGPGEQSQEIEAKKRNQQESKEVMAAVSGQDSKKEK